jgi:hypothetical protein
VVITGVNGIPQANGRFYVNPLSPTTFQIWQDQAVSIPVPLTPGTYVLSGKASKWTTTQDTVNGSLLITHTRHSFLGLTNGKVKIRGVKTGIIKEINFNY